MERRRYVPPSYKVPSLHTTVETETLQGTADRWTESRKGHDGACADMTKSFIFHVLLRRETKQSRWGFLNYKHSFPIVVGSVQGELLMPVSSEDEIQQQLAQYLPGDISYTSSEGVAEMTTCPAQSFPVNEAVPLLQKHDVLLAINGEVPKSHTDASRLFHSADLTLLLLVKRSPPPLPVREIACASGTTPPVVRVPVESIHDDKREGVEGLSYSLSAAREAIVASAVGQPVGGQVISLPNSASPSDLEEGEAYRSGTLQRRDISSGLRGTDATTSTQRTWAGEDALRPSIQIILDQLLDETHETSIQVDDVGSSAALLASPCDKQHVFESAVQAAAKAMYHRPNRFYGTESDFVAERILSRLPSAPRCAVYDRSQCPFTKEDGFTEDFHAFMQTTMTTLALPSGHRSGSKELPPNTRGFGSTDLVVAARQVAQRSLKGAPADSSAVRAHLRKVIETKTQLRAHDSKLETFTEWERKRLTHFEMVRQRMAGIADACQGERGVRKAAILQKLQESETSAQRWRQALEELLAAPAYEWSSAGSRGRNQRRERLGDLTRQQRHNEGPQHVRQNRGRQPMSPTPPVLSTLCEKGKPPQSSELSQDEAIQDAPRPLKRQRESPLPEATAPASSTIPPTVSSAPVQPIYYTSYPMHHSNAANQASPYGTAIPQMVAVQSGHINGNMINMAQRMGYHIVMGAMPSPMQHMNAYATQPSQLPPR